MIPHIQENVVFITGSSSGIGRATALRFANAGYSVVVSYYHDEEAGRRVVEECREAGASKTLLVRLDVKDILSIQTSVGEVVNMFGHIDVLINNSGVAVKQHLIEQSEEVILNQIATNLTGSIMLTRACLPSMRRGIIFIGSKTSLRGKRSMSVYSATKFGIRGFAESLALEYPQLCVLVVNPGIVATRLGNSDGESPDVVADIVFKSASREYRVRSGGYVNVWEYRHGRMVRYAILALLVVKRMIKEILRIKP